ncbi:SAM-dependent methlyltransferase [Dehalococcoides mccartyi]|uniref:SAM-dependent methlyltransferase n=1 Tax=Dehalococcoides mccartyi TaxID=61435 RepID=A0A0V8M4D1_9CHLR|nr:class I SAM-dependent methyltransferase [Dehalococcoides mccartyi]KSV18586.1 SAM-dependent methlyltransferase [Dehalococcoides mccartyi]
MNEQNFTSQEQVFDQIAAGWYSFRHRSIFSHELSALAAKWQTGKLLNAGCGCGADFIPFKDSFELYGIDFSAEMIEQAGKYARKHGFKTNLAVAEMQNLPFKDAEFDWLIAVASFHHLKGQTAQEKALKEFGRVLKDGGQVFLTVWNRLQPRFWFKGRETLVPWKSQDQVLMRYYRLYTCWEIEALVKKAGFRVVSSFGEKNHRRPKYFARNICLVLEKQTLKK